VSPASRRPVTLQPSEVDAIWNGFMTAYDHYTHCAHARAGSGDFDGNLAEMKDALKILQRVADESDQPGK